MAQPVGSMVRAEPPVTTRALVAVEPVAARHEPPPPFRQAPFLAQLIAGKDHHPQARERRRAAPAEAIAAYRAAARLVQ